jgi:hypothetical protein
MIGGYFNLLASYINQYEGGKADITDMQYLSLVLCANTFCYCSETMPGLAATIQEKIDAFFKGKIDFEQEQQAFDLHVNRSIQMMTACMVAHMSPGYDQFSKHAWSDMTDSAYECTDVTQQSILYMQERVTVIAPRLAPAYQPFFYNQLAQGIISRFTTAVFSCRKVSADGVQQLMIDAKAWLTALEGVPLLGFAKIQHKKDDLVLDDLQLVHQIQDGPRKVPPAYLKYVRTEMGKIDGALKVVGAIKEQVVTSYLRLFEKTANASELAKFLELRVDLRGDDRKAILDQVSIG